MKTLSKYLSENASKGIIDHVIRTVHSTGLGNEASFYIHPLNADGDTLDFTVQENSLVPAQIEYRCEDGHSFNLIICGAIEEEYLKCPYCQKSVKEVD